jgi:hypothetical protein
MRKIFIILLLVVPSVVYSQDRVFNYTYQSIVLSPGQRELEVWSTLRTGREHFYRALDTRVEFEFGLCKNMQLAFYLNSKTSSAEKRTLNNFGVESITIEDESEFSFSTEWKYKLADPVANTIGFALYGEVTVAPKELELEAKLIFDKKIGRTMHAFNIVGESEWETEIESKTNGLITEEEVEHEQELKFEFDYGFSYNINSNWNVGFELRNKNTIEDSEWYTSALYAGPGFSWAKGPIWINLTLLPQVAGLKNPYNDGNSLLLKSNEKLETRLLFSYVF